MAQFFYQFDGDLNFICTNYAIQVDEQTDFSVKLVQYCNQGGNPNITYALVNASYPIALHTPSALYPR
ncbi:hypothetical protein [Alicyclobacillus sp. SP_1]|uniref:hypothetical protein n=1 Tax=Alicyclobacillus sp. SP_1 TaxID=2942475 RepID=UPI002157FAB2|nr:hypothetical protein [Alicyclobacillus sp. SP_1]